MAISKAIEKSSIKWHYVVNDNATIEIPVARNKIMALYAVPESTSYACFDITGVLKSKLDTSNYYLVNDEGRGTKRSTGTSQGVFCVRVTAETENSFKIQKQAGSSSSTAKVYFVYALKEE